MAKKKIIISFVFIIIIISASVLITRFSKSKFFSKNEENVLPAPAINIVNNTTQNNAPSCSNNNPQLFSYIGEYEDHPDPNRQDIIKKGTVKINTDLIVNETLPFNINLFDGECYIIDEIKEGAKSSYGISFSGKSIDTHLQFLVTIGSDSLKHVLFTGYTSGYTFRMSGEYMIQIDKSKMPPVIR